MHRTTFISQDTLLKFNERTYGPNIYNSDFSAAALCPHCYYPHSRYLSQFFPLPRHIFPSFTFTVIIIGPSADQFWSHYIQKSLLCSSMVLSVFQYVAFHYAGKPVTRLSVYMSLPTACVITYFVQTWRYIPLFIISAPSTYFIHSDVLWTGQSGDWIALGVRFFHSRPPTSTPGLWVGQGGRKVVLNTGPF